MNCPGGKGRRPPRIERPIGASFRDALGVLLPPGHPDGRCRVPDVGQFEPVLDRFAEHLRSVRNRAPSTVANSRHYLA